MKHLANINILQILILSITKNLANRQALLTFCLKILIWQSKASSFVRFSHSSSSSSRNTHRSHPSYHAFSVLWIQFGNIDVHAWHCPSRKAPPARRKGYQNDEILCPSQYVSRSSLRTPDMRSGSLSFAVGDLCRLYEMF